MQVQRIRFNAVKLAVCSDLGLALVEVRLCACLAVELLDFVGGSVEQITVVRLLVRSREPTENQNVLQ